MPPAKLAIFVVAAALFMENMDSTVIATALPAIAFDLKVEPVTLKLAFTAYLLSLAVFIPVSGWVADKFGARNVLRAAIAVFTLGSLACGLASSLEGFVAARMLQGLGGALMVPVGRLVVLRLLPKSELVGAMSLLTIPALFAPLIGPPVGGAIATFWHWRYIFLINLPIGVLGIFLASWYVPATKEEDPGPLDFFGLLYSGLGLSMLVFGSALAGSSLLERPWLVAGLLGFGASFVGIYVLHGRRVANPLLDLSLLRLPTFRASVFGGSLFRIGIGAIPFLLPLMLQLGFGLTPFQSGSLTFVAAAGALTMKTIAPPILRKFGYRRVLLVNGVLSALLIAANGFFTATTPIILMLTVLLLGGLCRSLQFTSLNTLAFADVDQSRMSRATSLTSVAQQLSISAGVTLAALVLEALHKSGQPLVTGDFQTAFFVVAAVSLLAQLVIMKLPKDAGASLVGSSIGNT